ncbi:MAG TPA: TMEM175 family protein [Xanthobacteraceae bacterium]|nr:TMEM175 family protein [Xanthobacteraceae bacterium]
MPKERLAAFSDGVIAIIITIMVLELKVPHGADWAALAGVLPIFLAYVLSFVYLAIYWNNHHHMIHTLHQVNGLILWATCTCCSGSRSCRSRPPGSARRISRRRRPPFTVLRC